jgi:hypothetical protein
MDLQTTYTHGSELLQAITAPPLISTIHKSAQHTLSLFQPAVDSPTDRPSCLQDNSSHGPRAKYNFSIIACVFVSAGTCLPTRCLDMGCITPFIKNPMPEQRVYTLQ